MERGAEQGPSATSAQAQPSRKREKTPQGHFQAPSPELGGSSRGRVRAWEKHYSQRTPLPSHRYPAKHFTHISEFKITLAKATARAWRRRGQSAAQGKAAWACASCNHPARTRPVPRVLQRSQPELGFLAVPPSSGEKHRLSEACGGARPWVAMRSDKHS